VTDVRGAARRVRGLGRSWRSRAGARRRASHAAALVRAGLVDRGWLELQSGTTWPDSEAAAGWYLGAGARAGASPHRLFEPEWVTGGPEPTGEVAVRAARDLAAQQRAHPLVDGGPGLAELLPTLAPGTVLGRSGRGPTYAHWCELVDAAELLRQGQSRLAGRRTTSSWDTEADARFVTQWSGAALPATDGPIVSVVMPVRNRPVLVAEAIASVRRQTLDSWELLVVDDGSDDDTPDVVAAIAAEDSRIRLIRQDSLGVCAARNAAIDAATGAYVAFLDSDNTWVDSFLGVAVSAMHGQRLDAAFAVVDEVSERGHRYRTYEGDSSHLQVGNFVDLNVLVVSTPLIRATGGFDLSLRRMVDYDLVWRLAKRGPVTLLPFVGVHYRAHADAVDRISAVEASAWDDVVKAHHLIDWSALRASAGDRDSSVVSVIVASGQERDAIVGTVTAVLADSDAAGIRSEVVVVVDPALSAPDWRLLWAQLGLDDRVSLVRAPCRLDRAALTSLGLARTTGSVVAVLPAGTIPAGGGLAALVDPVRSDRAAATAAPAVDGVMACRADLLVAAGGLDPVFAQELEVDDLHQRLAAAGQIVVEVDHCVSGAATTPAPTDAQRRDNEREWARRHPDVPLPPRRGQR